MRFCIVAFLLAVSFNSSVSAQEGTGPFPLLDAIFHSTKEIWICRDVKGVSDQLDLDRARLGDSFGIQLLNYAGDDIDRINLISDALIARIILQSDNESADLALKLQERGIVMMKGKSDVESVSTALAMSVNAAMLSQELGNYTEAARYKHDAQKLANPRSSDSGYLPNFSGYRKCLYESIGDPSTKPCSREKISKMRMTECSMGGPLNCRAKLKPDPEYPPMARAQNISGTVAVDIVVDESGKVISARATSGRPMLQEAAVVAARKARFHPTTLSGTPVKVSGSLIYLFRLY